MCNLTMLADKGPEVVNVWFRIIIKQTIVSNKFCGVKVQYRQSINKQKICGVMSLASCSPPSWRLL